MKQIVLNTCILVVTAMVLVGCGSYYKVTDPTTDKIYYTEDIDKKKDGAIIFKDAVSDKEITLQNSEVEGIDKKEFKAITEPPAAE